VSNRSLEFRLVRLQIGLAAGVIVLFSVSALWLSERVLSASDQSRLQEAAASVARSVELELANEHPGDLTGAASEALTESAPIGVGVEVLDASDRVLASRPHPGHPDEEVRTLVVPLPGGGRVRAATPVSPRRHAVVALAFGLALSALPLLLLAAALSRALARHSLRPLQSMARQAGEASYSGRPQALGSDRDPAELRHFAVSFNRLIERFHSQVEAERHFVHDAAHELRTPLGVMMGEIEHALVDPGLPPRARAALERTQVQARGLSELVEALLLLRSADAGSLRIHEAPAVNLADLVRDVTRDLLDAAPQRARDLALEVPDELLVSGREMLLAAAVRNLAGNALKFTTQGQPIRIRVKGSGPWGVVEVEDGGPGIADGERDRIFDPFYRGPEARARSTGFGLGLPLMRRVAVAHGGEIEVGRSGLGGARFELRVPRWSEQVDATASA
jgi:signal transduction histidine kinase